MDVTVYGKKKILMSKINSIKKKNEEEFAKKLAQIENKDNATLGGDPEDEIAIPKLFRIKSTNL